MPLVRCPVEIAKRSGVSLEGASFSDLSYTRKVRLPHTPCPPEIGRKGGWGYEGD
ncbi:MAG: hypothetical protein PVG14_19615 [Anaerolineales bacterium]|jgi:hypothetical protein